MMKKLYILLWVMVGLLTAVTTACQVPVTRQTDTRSEFPEFALPEKGFIRANPLPAGAPIETANWTVEVLRFSRGQEAWDHLKALPYGNEAPAIDEEYVLLNLRITHNNKAADVESIGIALTGSAGLTYYSFRSELIPPTPYLNSSVAGGESEEGWYTFVIAENESDLMLVIDEYASTSDPLTYAALEEGATIVVPNDLDAIQPTNRGKDAREPAPFGTAVTTENWQITVTDVILGDEAWDILLQTNQFNEPPPEGIMYVLVKAKARYLGQSDEPAQIFSYHLNLRGESGTLYTPPPLVEPTPWFDFDMYPGAEAEGWIALAVPNDESEFVLRFNPGYGDDDPEIRYLSLDATGR
jgi:hypothetical protein